MNTVQFLLAPTDYTKGEMKVFFPTLHVRSIQYEFSPLLEAPPIFSTRLITPSGTSSINGGSCLKTY